jgi:hypothetical protein
MNVAVPKSGQSVRAAGIDPRRIRVRVGSVANPGDSSVAYQQFLRLGEGAACGVEDPDVCNYQGGVAILATRFALETNREGRGCDQRRTCAESCRLHETSLALT